MSLYVFAYVCPGGIFILDSCLAIFFGKKLSFWLSACSVLKCFDCGAVALKTGFSKRSFWLSACSVLIVVPLL